MNKSTLFIDNVKETKQDFYHALTRTPDKSNGVYEPPYDGIDSLIIYTLTPGARSDFKDI